MLGVQSRLIIRNQILFLRDPLSSVTLNVSKDVRAAQANGLYPTLVAGNPLAEMVGNANIFWHPTIHREQRE